MAANLVSVEFEPGTSPDVINATVAKIRAQGMEPVEFEPGTPQKVIDSTLTRLSAQMDSQQQAQGQQQPNDVPDANGQFQGGPQTTPQTSQNAPGAAQPQDNPSVVGNLNRAASRGLRGLATFPADLIAGVAKAGAAVNDFMGAGREDYINAPKPQEPTVAGVELSRISPSDQMKAGLDALGVETRDPVKEGRPMAERFIDNATEAAAGGLGGLGVASLAQRATPGAVSILTQNLGKAGAAELLQSTAGATAQTIAEGDNGEHPIAGAAAQIAANVLVGGSVASWRKAQDSIDEAMGSSAVQNMEGGAPKEKAVREAARLAKEAVRAGGGTVTGAKEALDANALRVANGEAASSVLTSGAASGDVGILGLEKRALGDAGFAARFDKTKENINDFVRGSIRTALGTPDATDGAIDYFRTRASTIMNTVEKAYQGALGKLHGALNDAKPRDPADISQEFRTSFDDVYKNAREAERQAWEISGAKSGVKPLAGLVDEIKNGASAADLRYADENMPSGKAFGTIEDLIDKAKEAKDRLIPTTEIQSARSSILAEARQARYDGQTKKAARLNDMADRLLTVMDKNTVGLDQGQIDNARKLTKDLNLRFNDNDQISNLLRKTQQGTNYVPDNQTLDKLIVPGERGATNVMAIKNIFGDIPDSTKEFVTSKFFKAANDVNGFNAAKASRFISDYGSTLDQTGLRDKFQGMVDMAQRADRINSAHQAMLTDETRSATAKIFGFGQEHGYEDVVHGFETQVFGSKNPTAAMSSIVRAAEGNEQALNGIKSAAAEAVINRTLGKGGLTADSLENFQASKKALIDNGLLDKGEADRLEQIIRIGSQQLKSENATALAKGVASPQDSRSKRVLAGIIGFVGARFGSQAAKLGSNAEAGSSLRGAAKGGRLAEQAVMNMGSDEATRVLTEAVFNPKLMRALLASRDDIGKSNAEVLSDFLKRTTASGSLVTTIHRAAHTDSP